ncbi:MAG: DUF1285 domain-containing protein [Blastomonas sp.]
MPYDPPPELASLTMLEIAERVAARKLPPIEQWDPPHSGDSFMRIDSQGQWFHKGEPIRRPAMVRLFATILRREADGSFALVTPFEKQAIMVEDAPLVAVEFTASGTGRDLQIAFRLNTDELVIAGPGHPLHFVTRKGEQLPYVTYRPGIDARIGRNIYYDLVELALAGDGEETGLWSNGAWFAFPDGDDQ